MKALSAEAADRLAKLCGLFGSDHAAERATAASMADCLVRAHGLTWPDVIVVPRQQGPRLDAWRGMAIFCSERRHLLNEKERGFITNLLRWQRELSERQQQWLTDLFLRCGGAS
jgi:hypothetical protein